MTGARPLVRIAGRGGNPFPRLRILHAQRLVRFRGIAPLTPRVQALPPVALPWDDGARNARIALPHVRSLSLMYDDARAIFDAAVRRVRADRLLDATPPDAWAPHPLDAYQRVFVVGMGKASMAMAGAVEARLEASLGDALRGGPVVVPDGYPATLPGDLPRPHRATVHTGGHPTPTLASERAGRAMLDVASRASDGDLVLVLVSGGGTSLASVPADGLEIEDLQDVYRRILRAGIDIHAANAVRKHLTAVGGGQLARAAHPAHVAALVVSDVVGDDLSTVASGPTVPDPTTYEDAVRVLYRSGLWHDVTPAVRERLSRGANGRAPETPSDGDACFDDVRTTLVGGNAMALDAARVEAEARGYAVGVMATGLNGEARAVGHDHGRSMREAVRTGSVDGPTCWLWGGETTVTVTGAGTGGRNQEVALGAAQALDGWDRDAIVLSGGTDGIDGPTDAAGAWATPETVHAAAQHGLDAADHLARNDAYAFFDGLDQLVQTGPTHTNVMDVHVGLCRGPSSSDARS